MTAFFVGGLESQGKVAESAYLALQERSHEFAGSPPRHRRIFKLSCRLEGRDTEIEVGRPLALGGEPVAAIMDHGPREDFVVHTSPGKGGVGVPLHSVYSVTEFS